MGTNPNTQTLKQVWEDQYQLTHYKQPVFRAIAEEKMLTGKLKKGDTIHWSYMSDFYVENMGGDGSYNTQAQSDTDETLVINQVKDTSFYEFEKDLEQAHYAVKADYARKAMNKIFLQIDSDVLVSAYLGASTVIDNGNLTGSTASGTPITISSGNVSTLFSVAVMQLQLNNVIYDPNLTFTGEVKLEKVTGMPVAIISPQVYQALVLYLGGKTTVLGDKVSVSGHAGAFMSFNIFVSNQTPSTVSFSLGTNPTATDTFTINGYTFTFVSTIGSTAGNILIQDTAAHTQTLLTNIMSSLFTNVSGSTAQTASTANWVPFTSSVTAQNALANLSFSNWSSNKSTLTQGGIGTMLVTAVTLTTSTNLIGGTASSTATAATVVQHNISGISKSVGLCLQHKPSLYVNPVSGKVGKDYVTWCFYGIKVFKYMTTQLLDVQVAATSFASRHS